MDPVMHDLGQYLNQLEEQEMYAWKDCVEAAQAAGHSVEEAENCDDGEWKCPNCPWKKKK